MFHELFEKYSDEHGEFRLVENKTSNRRDLHAFNLLDRLLPGECPLVSCAEHDEIWLDINCDELENVITEEQIRELVRCGIRYDNQTCSLARFV